MGLIPQKPYKQKNKATGLWETVYPKPIEYTTIKDSVAPLVLNNHKAKKKYK